MAHQARAPEVDPAAEDRIAARVERLKMLNARPTELRTFDDVRRAAAGTAFVLVDRDRDDPHPSKLLLEVVVAAEVRERGGVVAVDQHCDRNAPELRESLVEGLPGA